MGTAAYLGRHRGLNRYGAGRPVEHLRPHLQAATAGSYFGPHAGRHSDCIGAAAYAITLSRIDAYVHAATYPNLHPCANADAHLDTDSYAYTSADAHRDTDSYAYASADAHPDTDPYAYASADAHPDTSSYAYTSV